MVKSQEKISVPNGLSHASNAVLTRNINKKKKSKKKANSNAKAKRSLIHFLSASFSSIAILLSIGSHASCSLVRVVSWYDASDGPDGRTVQKLGLWSWKPQNNELCERYTPMWNDYFDAPWNVAIAFSILSCGIGSTLVLYLWWSVFYPFLYPSRWRWLALVALFAGVFEFLSLLMLTGNICTEIYDCRIIWGAWLSCIASTLWFISSLLMLYVLNISCDTTDKTHPLILETATSIDSSLRSLESNSFKPTTQRID
mmetsp:Transcript_4638/g.5151  ORF Transcript_4638/g.5151 Transcript_4638/m.5151 type:complete len:256 (+) Transcript_4638:38-805(+)